MNNIRKSFSMEKLLKEVRKVFSSVPEKPSDTNKRTIPLADYLMSGLAVFVLKFPSLLKYDEKRRSGKIKNNLAKLFGVQQFPRFENLIFQRQNSTG